MIKKRSSVIVAAIVTMALTTTAYAQEDILTSISAGAAKKVSVSETDTVSARKSGKSKASAKKTEAGKAESKKDSASGSSKASAEADSIVENNGLCVADVDSLMNVRAEASEDSAVVGYMYKDCVGEVIERKDGWTRLRSGVLEGWAKDDYLLFGDAAKEKTDGALIDTAVVNADKLRIREEASEDAEIKAMLVFGDEVEVISTDDGWTKVSYEDGTSGSSTGYVSNDYITIKTAYRSGETVEQVKEREERSKAAREDAKKDKEDRKSDATTDNSGDDKAAEAVKAAADEIKEAAVEKAETAVTDNGAISASVDDETLLAALIQCECNGPYEAQLAVGAVVVNRAKYGYGSISNAIYAPYQFGPASSGKLALTISAGAISPSARQAAHDAISGLSNIGTARYFRNVSSGHAGIVIGNHVYW